MLDTVLLQEVGVPSSGFSLFFSFGAWEQIYCLLLCQTTFELDNIHNITVFLFCFFFLPQYCSHVFLQKETRGPPQPLRQRAPPAKTPREVEARPKLSQRPKGGRAEEWTVERKQVKVGRHGGRKETAYIGCPKWTRGHLHRSLPACLELQRPKCSPFHRIRL